MGYNQFLQVHQAIWYTVVIQLSHGFTLCYCTLYMAESLQCMLCGKPATVHLTQIMNGKIHKMDLCDGCAKDKGIADPEGFSFMDALAGKSLQDEEDQAEHVTPPTGLVCTVCGFTPADFKRIGRFGCPNCYTNFKPIIGPMLQNMHKDTQHRGKVPARSLERVNLQRRLEELEQRLQEAIKTERYEEAARFRDEINQVRQAMLTQVSQSQKK